MENNMGVSQKIKIGLPYHSAIPLLGIYAKQMETAFWWDMYSYVYHSIIHNRQDMETTHMPISEWMDKNDVLEDFPGGIVVKNPPANAGDMGSSPGLGRSHMTRNN